MRQILMFRDPSPLVDRLGRDFFRQLPESPGVYLMRGASDELLYIGKAKNLRNRLGHYRVANPDRMPRRHLRLLRAVERIEIEQCPDEPAALQLEAQLLRRLKPRFNRAGTWPAAPWYLAVKSSARALRLAVTRTPEIGWQSHGPLGSGARHLRAALVRVLWFALWPERGFSQMPAGWFRGQCGDIVTLDLDGRESPCSDEIFPRLDGLLAGRAEGFAEWVLGRLGQSIPLFDQAVLQEDIEFLMERFAEGPISPGVERLISP